MNDNLYAVVILSIFLVFNVSVPNISSIDFKPLDRADGDTEYWALLVAVGVYADRPDQKRPPLLSIVDDLYDVLIASGWSADHIKVIKGKDATVENIIKGLRWLDKMDDGDDLALVYFSTHGSSIPGSLDIPPKDEEDGCDEVLLGYWGFAYPMLGAVWDDEINLLISRLDAEGICLIVWSCQSGGFSEPVFWNREGKIVITACQEDESPNNYQFLYNLIDALRGFADFNSDGMISAEEVFNYSKHRIYTYHPTLYDDYPGEFPLIHNPIIKSKRNDQNLVVDNKSIQNYNMIKSEFEKTNKLFDSHNKKSENKKISEIINGNIHKHNDILRNGNNLDRIRYDESPENSVVCGFVKDSETQEPINNAYVQLYWYDGENYDWNFTYSNGDGFYSLNVAAGEIDLYVSADGYFSEHTDTYGIGEYETLWINISLMKEPSEDSIVCGFVKDSETQDPVDNAYVELYWHDGGNYDWNSTYTNGDGFYSMNVAAGKIHLYIDADGYLNKDIDIYDIGEYDTLWINISLRKKPPENSTVCGYILHSETQEPVNDEYISLKWYDDQRNYYSNSTHSDISGFYSMNVVPGEIFLRCCHEVSYRYDAEEHDNLWINFSVNPNEVHAEIIKPLKAIYRNDDRIVPFPKTLIFGEIDIRAFVHDYWYNSVDVEKVEFYIDNTLTYTDNESSFNWTWDEKSFGKHTIKIIAYDEGEHTHTDELEVWKFF